MNTNVLGTQHDFLSFLLSNCLFGGVVCFFCLFCCWVLVGFVWVFWMFCFLVLFSFLTVVTKQWSRKYVKGEKGYVCMAQWAVELSTGR